MEGKCVENQQAKPWEKTPFTGAEPTCGINTALLPQKGEVVDHKKFEYWEEYTRKTIINSPTELSPTQIQEETTIVRKAECQFCKLDNATHKHFSSHCYASVNHMPPYLGANEIEEEDLPNF